MQVFLFAVDKRNKTSKSEVWVGTNKYPTIQLGVFDKVGSEFTQLSGFPLFGIPSKYRIRCIYDLNVDNAYDMCDGKDVTLKPYPYGLGLDSELNFPEGE